MKIEKQITMRNLVPSQGLYLTQANDVAEGERVYSTSIWLGVDDSEENWREADEAEKAAYDKAERERIAKEEPPTE